MKHERDGAPRRHLRRALRDRRNGRRDPPDGVGPRPRRGPGTHGTHQDRLAFDPPEKVAGEHRGAIAVLATCTAQLDALAALGADAEIHGVVVPQVTWVAAVDRIAQRQSAALTVIDLRDEP